MYPGQRKAKFDTEHFEGIFNFAEHYEPDLCYNTAFIGSRFSGKTTTLKVLHREKSQNIDMDIWFSNNLQAPIYKEFLIDRRFAFHQYHAAVIKDVNYFQRKSENLLRNNFNFDDCSSMKGNKYDDSIAQLNLTARNWNANLWFSTQALTFISKSNRANLDAVFLHRTNTDDEQETVCQKFLKGFVKRPEGYNDVLYLEYIREWYNAVTEDHSAIFINYRKRKMYYFNSMYHQSNT